MFAKTGAKIGDVAYVRKPPRYIARIGAGVQRQATVQTRVPVKIDKQVGVDLPFSSVERTLSLDNYSDNVIKPALVATIANQIDYDGLQLYKEVYNLVGTPGTAPASTVGERLLPRRGRQARRHGRPAGRPAVSRRDAEHAGVGGGGELRAVQSVGGHLREASARAGSDAACSGSTGSWIRTARPTRKAPALARTDPPGA